MEDPTNPALVVAQILKQQGEDLDQESVWAAVDFCNERVSPLADVKIIMISTATGRVVGGWLEDVSKPYRVWPEGVTEYTTLDLRPLEFSIPLPRQVKRKNTPHGPVKVGRGGKVRRW